MFNSNGKRIFLIKQYELSHILALLVLLQIHKSSKTIPESLKLLEETEPGGVKQLMKIPEIQRARELGACLSVVVEEGAGERSGRVVLVVLYEDDAVAGEDPPV